MDHVESISTREGMALVRLALDKGHSPVYRDGTVLLRTKTLVGENYIELDSGHPQAGALPDGGTLPLSAAKEAVQLDDILSGLDARTRSAVRRNLDALGAGFSGRGTQVNSLFAAVKPVAVDGGAVMRILRRRRDELARVVDATGQVMQSLADRTIDLRRLATGAKASAEAAASRDAALGQAIDELPATLRQARASVTKLGSFSRRAAPVVSDLRTAVHHLAPVFPRLRPAAAQTSALLKSLPAFNRRPNPMLAALPVFAKAGTPAITALDATLRQANPALAYLAPYSRDVSTFFATVGSANDTTDAVGNLARLFLIVDEGSLDNWTPEMRKLLGVLFDSGGLSKTHAIGSNAYPKPGKAGNPEQFTGEYPRLQADPPR